MTQPSLPTPPIEVHATPGQPLGMAPARFLSEYWQKHPLLIRGAFPDLELPLQPDDLGGLACEEDALSRIVVHDPAGDRWGVHNGPFDEDDFARLPPTHWTLLVQDVDKWDPDVARLLQPFDFLPSWRLDDIMISYAEDGGGVGAHVDQYDVFLLQGLGRRRWAISTDPDAPLACRDDVELKLLRQFEPTHAWTLMPGDMLYLPPGVPHDGVAEGACMTFSVGMRAPSHAELLLDLAETCAEALPESDRYRDPDLEPARGDGEIDAAALERVADLLGPLASLLPDRERAHWFGRFITRYRSAQPAMPPEQPPHADALERALRDGATLQRHPWTRMAWHAGDGDPWLFVGGEAMPCPADLARALCTQRQFSLPAPSPGAMAVLDRLVRSGHLTLEDRA